MIYPDPLYNNEISKFSLLFPKNVLPKLQTEDDLEIVLTKPNANSVEAGTAGLNSMPTQHKIIMKKNK